MCVCVWMGWGAVFSRKRKRALNNRSRERERERAERCGSYRISSVGAGSAGSSFERPRTEADYRTHPFPQHRPPGVEKDRQRERERERERERWRGGAFLVPCCLSLDRRFWFREIVASLFSSAPPLAGVQLRFRRGPTLVSVRFFPRAPLK